MNKINEVKKKKTRKKLRHEVDKSEKVKNKLTIYLKSFVLLSTNELKIRCFSFLFSFFIFLAPPSLCTVNES